MVGNDLLNQLREERRRLMPSSEEVVRESLRRIGQDLSDPDFVRANFNALLRELFRRTLEVLEEYEEWVDLQLIERALGGWSVQDYARAVPSVTRVFLERFAIEKAKGWKGFRTASTAPAKPCANPLQSPDQEGAGGPCLAR